MQERDEKRKKNFVKTHRWCFSLLILMLLIFTGTSEAYEASLSPHYNAGDGTYTTTTRDGQTVWIPGAYLYFQAPVDFPIPIQSAYVEITYYDEPVGSSIVLQYDSASAPYTTTLFHTRSSGEGTDIFVKSYQRLDDPLFADRQNGGSDFRINAGGFPISSVVVRDTPFSDPYAAYALSHTPPWLTPYTGPSYDDVYADSLKGKVVTGYQGWFRTPNDLHDSGWGHWGTSSSGGTSTVDMWPNPLDYETSSLHPFPGALTESGKQGYLFSSADPAVVQKHFEWMRKYNIDGVYLQRFFTNAAAGAKPEWVLDLVREAAHLHGRVWAIEYDISGGSDANLYNTITADWMWLVDEVGITNDSRYLHEDGKPVVVVWGAGIRDGITQASMDPLIDFFKNDPVYGGNYVVGCVKNSFPSDWNSHFEMYDSIFAWMGDYQNLANFANPRGMDTQVHVWPGFSWHNLQQFVFPYQYTDRGSGSFLWGKVSNGIDIIDPDTIFVGMFDEYDEATAIMPMSDDPPVLTGEIGHYITNTNYYTSHTVPSDWWMTLSSYAKEVLCNQVPFSFTMPTEASLDNRSNIGQELSVDLGATNVSDLLVQEEPADGPTVSDVIDGVTCRRATGLYMYFDVDDATLYQVAAGQDVTIIVDYYDTSDNVTIGIHYDSVPNQWQTHPKSFTTLGTNEWQTVRFEIDDAYFGNRENGADFRLRSNTVYNMNIARVRVILAESLLEVTVPDVVGLTQAAAELDIVAAGLVVGTVTMTASPTVPAGDVISQNPAASTSVDIGSSVDIEVSLGAVPVDVPNVVGQAQATAEGNIVAVGLVVGTVTPVSSETVPFGEVISQDPIGGTSVAAGSSVDLVVSTGPEPAADRTWSNADADRVWDNPANWSGGIVPRSIDKAAIRTNAIDGPIVDSSTAALVNLVVLGDWSTVGDTIDVTGGSLTTVGWFIMSYGAANDSTFNVSGGVTTVGSHMDIGFNGAAQMNMTGGTVNVSAEFKIAANVGSTGHVQLDGGTISSGSFIMANTATMDITNGTLIVSGDVTSTVNTYIGSGWITGYDGGGTVDVDYDISNAGKTTVTASNVGNVNVPDVVGLAQATAESDIVAAGLVVGTVTTAYSGSVPAGDVISQNPTGGSSVAPGSSVDIEVSLGVEMVAVPDVVGQAQATAESNIVAAGLVVGTVTTAYSGSVPAGDVISQDPVGSTSVVIGSSVDIEVSLGLAPVNVPDVVGLAQATAEADIVAADLIVGTVTTAYSGSVPAGDVISQNPTGGSSVAPGSSVDIEVSLGLQMVDVPDVVGQAQATAESNIVAAGLVVGTVTTAYSGSVPAGDVISQDPVGSTSVVIGSSVDIEVSLGLAPVTVPNVVGLSQATAESDIVTAGLVVGTVTTESSETVPAGDVISQNPTGGASVPAGSSVDLVVSTGPAPAVPAAPSGLSATAITITRIDLSWTDNATDETGFKIERSKRVNTAFAQIDTVGQDVTSYIDTTVKKNTRYYYRVRATNASGDSAYSNEADATTPR